MSRTSPPSLDEVHHAISAITEATGKAPSTLAVANQLGLANTTFRRQFPDIAATLTRNRSAQRGSQSAPQSAPYETLKQHNAKLRREIAELTEQLDLAIANIQRLTLENHRLRQERDEASRVTPITEARRRRSPT